MVEPIQIGKLDRLAYTYAGAAELLSVSKRTIQREVSLGHLLPLRNITGLISRNEILRWLAERTPKGNGWKHGVESGRKTAQTGHNEAGAIRG